MAIAEHAMVSGSYRTTSITASTDKRDVSQMLDLWAHKWTPVLNRVSWAEETGALSIEWISEHLGFGYVQTSATIASDGTSFVCTTSGTGLASGGLAAKAIQAGTLLYTKAASSDAFFVVTTIGTATVTFSVLVTASGGVSASAKLYILGHYANEGSDPFPDISRARQIMSNNFSILRKDVKITGSQANTDMHAIPGGEAQHQIAMRLLEMQLDRERSLIFSKSQARTSTVASFMKGIFDFLDDYSAMDWVDNTTTALTEDKFNDLVASCWDNGGNPNLFIADSSQVRKITKWDSNKVRTEPDAKVAGHFITHYLTDVGIDIELLPMRKFPVNFGFCLDTGNIKLRAKKGRKLILEKLAKTGDYDMWQLISEYTLAMPGFDKGYHGMFTRLT